MNKLKIYDLLKYLFLTIFCITAAALFACESVYKKVGEISSAIPFNYPGLRIESRFIKPDELKKYNPVIICFGDSVTFGWNVTYNFSYPSLLEKDLMNNHSLVKVINSGIGENTVIKAYSRLKRDILRFEPDYVILNFGLNDGMLQKKASRNIREGEIYYVHNNFSYAPQVEIDNFRNTYIEIVKILKQKDINLLLLGISPVTQDFPQGRDDSFQKMQRETYAVYNNAVKQIAEQEGIDYIDLYEVFPICKDLKPFIQADGLHPSEKGLELISKQVKMYLEDKIQ
jgi:lysophospholipase L1-like esterase